MTIYDSDFPNLQACSSNMFWNRGCTQSLVVRCKYWVVPLISTRVPGYSQVIRLGVLTVLHPQRNLPGVQMLCSNQAILYHGNFCQYYGASWPHMMCSPPSHNLNQWWPVRLSMNKLRHIHNTFHLRNCICNYRLKKIGLTGELWGVYCKDLGENWQRYNGTAL